MMKVEISITRPTVEEITAGLDPEQAPAAIDAVLQLEDAAIALRAAQEHLAERNQDAKDLPEAVWGRPCHHQISPAEEKIAAAQQQLNTSGCSHTPRFGGVQLPPVSGPDLPPLSWPATLEHERHLSAVAVAMHLAPSEPKKSRQGG